MQEYKEDSECVKCGESRHVSATWDSGVPKVGVKPPKGKKFNERIIRKCQNCLYEWDERPIDFKAN